MKTEIVVVVDKSGSMASKRSDVIGGFNTFLAKQRELPGEATLTLALFDTEYKLLHSNLPLQQVPDLNVESYVPQGGTALLDAIGKTITSMSINQQTFIGGVIKNGVPVPDKRVVFVIVTDGEENSSRLYTRGAIKEMITAREKGGNWETIYLGANQDSFGEAGSFGVKQGNVGNWNPTTADGLQKAFDSAHAHTTSYRGGMTYDSASATNWRPDDADQTVGKKK